MDRQDDFTRRFIDIGNDVSNQGPKEPLARAHSYPWRVPRGIEIVG
jgi:hypothetical protein